MRNSQARILTELRKAIVGQEKVIEEVLISLYVGGHSLITGLPGLAKTLMVQHAWPRFLTSASSGIQFTPDLMPSDITGTNDAWRRIEPPGKPAVPEFVQGPIFTNILLADEINRTPPKTQAALLQAMQERRGQRSGPRSRYSNWTEPFFVHRHAKSDRAGGHLSAARSAAGPLHVQHPHRLSE